jgi:hypothetical protein
MKPVQATEENYTELLTAYEFFNDRLFDGKLPGCLITMQRNKRTLGYYSMDRFVNRTGSRADEIAMNPMYFAARDISEAMQTLVHEMCHQWQRHFGTPSRGRYHNREWGDRMESIGLMPSSTGRPGGKKRGDQMMDYPIEGGLFEKACDELVTNDFTITWLDRFATIPNGGTGADAETISDLEDVGVVFGPTGQPGPGGKPTRVKYAHPCAELDGKIINIWGKPGLNVNCGDCGLGFLPLD